MDYYKLLADVAAYSVLLPLAIGLWQFTKKDRLAKLVTAYVVMVAIVEALGKYTSGAGQSNLWLSHLYIPFEYGILALIYFFVFRSVNIRRFIMASIILFTVFSIVDVLLGEGIDQMNSYPRVLESGLMITLALLYFSKVFNDLDKVNLERDPMFILSSGIIIYFAGTTMLYSLFNIAMAQSPEILRICIIALRVLIIFFNLILIMVIWRAPKVCRT